MLWPWTRSVSSSLREDEHPVSSPAHQELAILDCGSRERFVVDEVEIDPRVVQHLTVLKGGVD